MLQDLMTMWKVPRMETGLQFSKFPSHLSHACGQQDIWEGPSVASQIGHLC